MSVTSYLRLLNLVPNQIQARERLPNGTICKLFNLHIREYLFKHEK